MRNKDFHKKIFDIDSLGFYVKNQKGKIKSMLSCVPIYDSECTPIGVVSGKVTVSGGSYYAYCYLPQEYEEYEYFSCSLDYNEKTHKIIEIHYIILKK